MQLCKMKEASKWGSTPWLFIQKQSNRHKQCASQLLITCKAQIQVSKSCEQPKIAREVISRSGRGFVEKIMYLFSVETRPNSEIYRVTYDWTST